MLAIYVYFANKRIKNKLSEDEELKNSKKGAFLDSLRIGLIIEVFYCFLKINAISALVVILTGLSWTPSYSDFRYFIPNFFDWADVRLAIEIIMLILMICVYCISQIVIKYFIAKLILKKSGRKLKFKEAFSGLIVSGLAGFCILVAEFVFFIIFSKILQ